MEHGHSTRGGNAPGLQGFRTFARPPRVEWVARNLDVQSVHERVAKGLQSPLVAASEGSIAFNTDP